MKKTVLLNSAISAVVADMGHGDTLVLADAGLPVPPETEKIDLAVNLGLPAFLDVLDAVLSELFAESVTLAAEIKEANPEIEEEILKRCGDCPVNYVPHEEFKRSCASARAVVRTGEATPYANIILHSGVLF